MKQDLKKVRTPYMGFVRVDETFAIPVRGSSLLASTLCCNEVQVGYFVGSSWRIIKRFDRIEDAKDFLLKNVNSSYDLQIVHVGVSVSKIV